MPGPFPPLGASSPLLPPLYQSSVYSLPDLDALDAIATGAEPGYIYARDAHPNARHLAARIAQLEGGEWAFITGSGMGALSAIFLATVKQGSRVVASSRLYGRTTQLLTEQLARFGVTTTLVDTADLDAVRATLAEPAALVVAETLSNPLLRLADVPALAELAHAAGALLAVDNTFATPVLCRPLELGADLVMESLTKMLGGHSDVTLGAVAGRGELETTLAQAITIWGLASNPFDCWLADRGLQTLDVRMQAATANAASLADWLGEQPGVAQTVYPGRAEHPDHARARQLLGGEFGTMLCFDLAGGREAVNAFMRRAPGVPFSPSLGDTTTTLSYPAGTSHRYVDPAERLRQGITDGLIRLSVGIEPLGHIQAALASGLRG